MKKKMTRSSYNSKCSDSRSLNIHNYTPKIPLNCHFKKSGKTRSLLSEQDLCFLEWYIVFTILRQVWEEAHGLSGRKEIFPILEWSVGSDEKEGKGPAMK